MKVPDHVDLVEYREGIPPHYRVSVQCTDTRTGESVVARSNVQGTKDSRALRRLALKALDPESRVKRCVGCGKLTGQYEPMLGGFDDMCTKCRYPRAELDGS